MQRVVRVALTGLALALMVAGAARAQTPPMRTFGTASVDGQPAPLGTVVEALVGEKVCGEGTVRRVNNELPLGYVVDVISASTRQDCAGEGDRVTFRVGGQPAKETATFVTGSFLRLDLTVSGQVQTPTPGAATPPPFGGTTATPGAGGATATAPATGTGTATGTPTTVTPTATGTAAARTTATPTARATLSPRATPAVGGGTDGDNGGIATAAAALIAGLAVAAAAAVGYVLYRRSRTG